MENMVRLSIDTSSHTEYYTLYSKNAVGFMIQSLIWD